MGVVKFILCVIKPIAKRMNEEVSSEATATARLPRVRTFETRPRILANQRRGSRAT